MKDKIFIFIIVFFISFLLTSCFNGNDDKEVIICTSNQTLIDNVCVDNEPVVPTCTIDQTLIDNICVDNDPVVPTCTIDQTLIDNICVDNEPPCPNNQTLFEGVCYNDEIVANFPIIPEENTFSLKHLQNDFDQVVYTINTNSPKLFTDDTVLAEVIKEQRLLLVDGMSEIEFLRVLYPILVPLNDGHAVLLLSPDTSEAYVDSGYSFPMEIRLIDDKLYITDTEEDLDFILGDEIISINGMLSDEIITNVLNSIPSDGDNQTQQKEYFNYFFTYFYYTRIDTSLVLEIEFRHLQDPDTVLTTTVYAEVADIEEYPYFVLPVADYQGDLEPFTALFEEDYAILTINSFQKNAEFTLEVYADFFYDFFVEVESRGIENIILDVRKNAGGNSVAAYTLFRYLSNFPQTFYDNDSISNYEELHREMPLLEPHFDGNLYTIISGFSFSATGQLVSLLKYQDIGTFIGEESSGGYAHTSGLEYLVLNNTNIMLIIGGEIRTLDVEGLVFGRGVIPDYEMHKTLEDYIYKEDSIMDFIISLIEEQSPD